MITNHYVDQLQYRATKTIVEAVNDMVAFTALTDSILDTILFSESDDLKEVHDWTKHKYYYYFEGKRFAQKSSNKRYLHLCSQGNCTNSPLQGHRGMALTPGPALSLLFLKRAFAKR